MDSDGIVATAAREGEGDGTAGQWPQQGLRAAVPSPALPLGPRAPVRSGPIRSAHVRACADWL